MPDGCRAASRIRGAEHKEKLMKSLFSGKCGPDAVWSSDGVRLTIGGSGPMSEYYAGGGTPFGELCGTVTAITVGDGITSIGSCAFAGFTALGELELPQGVEYIGVKAFSGCSSLTRLTLPEGVRVIGPKSFENCTALTDISLPSTLSAVDFKAFNKDTAVSAVSFVGTPEQWRNQVHLSMSANGNKALTGAEVLFRETTLAYDTMTEHTAQIIRNGGDGRLHIVTPDLTVHGVSGKSGDCTFIIFPDGQSMMIDAGYSACGEHVMRLLGRIIPGRLDYFVLSHPHPDHIDNAPAVAACLNEKTGGTGGIGTYMYSGFEHKAAEKRLADYLEAHGTTLRRDLRAGDKFGIGGVDIELFNPSESDLHPDRIGEATVNNTSLAMKFTYGDSTYLTSGDLYADREEELAKMYGERLRADVVKTDHHGCFTSNCDAWLAALRPRIMISDCDDQRWTVFDEKLEREGIAHYRVCDRGLTVVSAGRNADYTVVTERTEKYMR